MKTYTPLRQRFLAKVKIGPESGCWLWQAYVDANGYGRMQRGPGVSPLAHRYAYEEFVGPIPDGFQLDHLCRTRACVNPAHLEPATPEENMLRGESFAAVNARKTHCGHGHPYNETNTVIVMKRSRETRDCLICARARKSAWKKRHPEKNREAWRRWRERQKAAA